MASILLQKRGYPVIIPKCIEIFGEGNRIWFVIEFSRTYKEERVGLKTPRKLVTGQACQ